MSVSVNDKNIGHVTAYAYAKAKGYTGTEEEFAQLMANYATVGQEAAQSAADAAQSASDAAGSAAGAETAKTAAQTAKTGAETAQTGAQAAKTAAETAQGKAETAQGKAETAQTEAESAKTAAAGSATAAATSATNAGNSATAAAGSATAAATAKTGAETAQAAAETAKTGAETAAASVSASAAQIETNKQDITTLKEDLSSKAEIDGYYEDMTVGDAEQLVSTVFADDSTPYLFRTTGGSADVGDREQLDAVVGGTVNLNQFCPNDVMHVTGTSALDWNSITTQSFNFSVITGHKYLFALIGKTVPGGGLGVRDASEGVVFRPTPLSYTIIYGATVTSNGTTNVQGKFDAGETDAYLNATDLTAMFGSAVADYIYSLEQATPGAGVAWFKKLFPKDYYEYNAGELLSVSGLASHDTVGFNQWDEEWESGNYDANGLPVANASTIRSKNFIPVLSDTAYFMKTPVAVQNRICFYDANKNFIARSDLRRPDMEFTTIAGCHYIKFHIDGTTYKNDICINLSWSGWRNGEYEAYQKHSYPLDDSLTLRGIPKLDAQNNLYYDGDEYLSDGTVNRRYGVVDLGTLPWVYTSQRFRAPLNDAVIPDITNIPNAITTIYRFYSANTDFGGVDKAAAILTGGGNNLLVRDSSYTDVATFKTAMSGVMLVYELAEPTTETADPYQHVQICDDFGTEEFISTSPVPVGHNTRYPANLRDKLQHLPDLADDDGYYMIGQSNKQMHLELFRIPKAPTSPDGTYVLKATVSGGTPTYTWEAQT